MEKSATRTTPHAEVPMRPPSKLLVVKSSSAILAYRASMLLPLNMDVKEKTSATMKLTVQKIHRNLRALHIVKRGVRALVESVRAFEGDAFSSLRFEKKIKNAGRRVPNVAAGRVDEGLTHHRTQQKGLEAHNTHIKIKIKIKEEKKLFDGEYEKKLHTPNQFASPPPAARSPIRQARAVPHDAPPCKKEHL